MSVVFDFNASLSAVTPVSPMLFPVDFDESGKELLVDRCHSFVLFLLSSH